MTNKSNVTTFRLKLIRFNGSPLYILLQKHNGPCPLLAIGNVLALRGLVRWGPGDSIEIGDIISGIVGYLYDTSGPLISSGNEEFTQFMNLVVRYLPTFVDGVNINVKFRHPFDFDEDQASQPASNIFFRILKQLKIRAVHSWVVDPADPLCEMIGSQSFDDIVACAHLTDDATGAPHPNSLLLQEFAQATKSVQSTTYGLFQIYDKIEDEEFAVFFRRNHYHVLTKHKGALYTLVTAEGYAGYPDVVWERVVDSENNTGLIVFVDEDFYALGERPRTPQQGLTTTPTSRRSSFGTPTHSASSITSPNMLRHHAATKSRARLPEPEQPCICVVM